MTFLTRYAKIRPALHFTVKNHPLMFVIRSVFSARMANIALVALLCSSTFAANAASPHSTLSAPAPFAQCRDVFADRRAPVLLRPRPGTLRALCYSAFAVLHSSSTKTPLYVAERISRAELLDAQGEKRATRFFPDARLPRAERAVLNDYKGSGYARGHMAPAGNMANPAAMAQSFSLANIVPQAPRNNSGPWASIEKATRKYALRARGDVYVITGPVFDDSGMTIGAGKVKVPRYLFKLVYDPIGNRAWAHWLENTEFARVGRPIGYEELVRRTGIDFLPGRALDR